MTHEPRTRVVRRFEFAAAHHLPHHAGDCPRMHGHNFLLEVEISGPVQSDDPGNPEAGMVMDFARLKKMVLEFLPDHRLLNDTMSNPTTERLVAWCWQELERRLGTDTPIRIERMRVMETDRVGAELRRRQRHG